MAAALINKVHSGYQLRETQVANSAAVISIDDRVFESNSFGSCSTKADDSSDVVTILFRKIIGDKLVTVDLCTH